MLAAAPGALASAASRALGEILIARAQSGPLAVILDDAHFAPRALLRALSYARAIQALVPLWTCFLSAPGLEDALVGGVDGGPVELLPLAEVDAHLLCRELLLPADRVPQDLVAELVEKAGRVPLYLTELVRGLKRQRVIERQGNRWVVATDRLDEMKNMPVVQWLARSATRQLSDMLRQHAGVAALLGVELSSDELEAVLVGVERAGEGAKCPLDAEVGLDMLSRQELCVRVSPRRYRFRNDITREAVIDAVGPALRVAVHRAAVDYYSSAEVVLGPIERLAKLAYHGARAGLGSEAYDWYVDCGQAQARVHAYLEAERSFSSALGMNQTPDRPARKLAALRERGRIRYRLGRYEAALADFGGARTLAQEAADPEVLAGVLLELATALDWNGQWGPAMGVVEEASALRDHLRTPEVALALDLAQARSLHRRGRNELAARSLSEVAARASALGEAGYELRVVALNLLSAALPTLGEISRAEELSDEAIALCRAHHDRLHLAGLTQNRVFLAMATNDAARAIRETQAARVLFRELGTVASECDVETNLGELAYLTGQHRQALEHVDRAMELQLLLYDTPQRPNVELLKARILFMTGDWHEAGAVLALVSEMQALDGERTQLLPAERMDAEGLALALSNAPDAAWQELMQQSEGMACETERVEIAEFRAVQARRAGDLGQARHFFERALARCHGSGMLLLERVTAALHELSTQVDLAERDAASAAPSEPEGVITQLLE